MVKVHEGNSALIISVPHAGTEIPDDIRRSMTAIAANVQDTDWYVDRLYQFAKQLDATMIVATLSRYVIDLNRDPQDNSLYPGQFTTSLCPVMTFNQEQLYASENVPSEEQICHRREQYWQPYHDQITAQISRIKSHHGHAVLLDAHSIASRVPELFTGQLCDLNFGTFNGQSCDAVLETLVEAIDHAGFSAVLNGRFKGGFITRHYGAPEQQIHAIQLELSQATYMNEETKQWDPAKATRLQQYLGELCQQLIAWKPATIATNT